MVQNEYYGDEGMDRLMVMMMGTHVRVGANAPFRGLEPVTIQDIVRISLRTEKEEWSAEIQNMIVWLQSHVGASDNLVESMIHSMVYGKIARKWLRKTFLHLYGTGAVSNASGLTSDLTARALSMHRIETINEPLLISLVMYDVESCHALNDTDAGVAIRYIQPTVEQRCANSVLAVACNPGQEQKICFCKLYTGCSRLMQISIFCRKQGQGPGEIKFVGAVASPANHACFAMQAVESYVNLDKLGTKLSDEYVFFHLTEEEEKTRSQSKMMLSVRRISIIL